MNEVLWVVDPRGRRLPVVDITHPAFGVGNDPALLQSLLDRDIARRSMSPGWVRRVIVAWVLRKSALAKGLRRGAKTFLGGLDTYLFKLGPEHLDPGWSQPIDKMIASSSSGLSLQLRLRDTAQLVADGLTDVAAKGSQPLTLWSLAGGPAAEAWNALILLTSQPEQTLAQRDVHVVVLDPNAEGPSFGATAVQALTGPSGPLAGVSLKWEHQSWNWTSTQAPWAQAGRIGGVVSEGGLFDYADDETVLRQLRSMAQSPSVQFVVGTLTRNDSLGANQSRSPRIPTVARSLDDLKRLAEPHGWVLQVSESRPLYHAFRLSRATG